MPLRNQGMLETFYMNFVLHGVSLVVFVCFLTWVVKKQLLTKTTQKILHFHILGIFGWEVSLLILQIFYAETTLFPADNAYLWGQMAYFFAGMGIWGLWEFFANFGMKNNEKITLSGWIFFSVFIIFFLFLPEQFLSSFTVHSGYITSQKGSFFWVITLFWITSCLYTIFTGIKRCKSLHKQKNTEASQKIQNILYVMGLLMALSLFFNWICPHWIPNCHLNTIGSILFLWEPIFLVAILYLKQNPSKKHLKRFFIMSFVAVVCIISIFFKNYRILLLLGIPMGCLWHQKEKIWHHIFQKRKTSPLCLPLNTYINPLANANMPIQAMQANFNTLLEKNQRILFTQVKHFTSLRQIQQILTLLEKEEESFVFQIMLQGIKNRLEMAEKASFTQEIHILPAFVNQITHECAELTNMLQSIHQTNHKQQFISRFIRIFTQKEHQNLQKEATSAFSEILRFMDAFSYAFPSIDVIQKQQSKEFIIYSLHSGTDNTETLNGLIMLASQTIKNDFMLKIQQKNEYLATVSWKKEVFLL